MKYQNTEFIRSNYELPDGFNIPSRSTIIIWTLYIHPFQDEESIHQSLIFESVYQTFRQSVLSKSTVYYAFTRGMLYLFTSEQNVLDAIDLYLVGSIHNS